MTAVGGQEERLSKASLFCFSGSSPVLSVSYYYLFILLSVLIFSKQKDFAAKTSLETTRLEI